MNTIDQILSAPLPLPRDAYLRSEPRKVWAKEVRTLLKDLGIQGVSVRARNYARAHSIDIEVPYDDDHYCAAWEPFKTRRDCAVCTRSWEAKQRLEELILMAFPDLDDRSDLQTDYFDFCLSVS